VATSPEQQYLDLLRECRAAPLVADRTGVGRHSVFGRQLRYDLSGRHVPLLTTKRVHFRSVALELFWMLGGHTNVRWLQERGVTIWDEWADEDGALGPVYGAQWRRWNENPFDDYEGVDQINRLLLDLKTNPRSSRHLVSAWNPEDNGTMALPPCHVMFQFHVAADERLSCHVYQRSADVFLGLPFNIASYALLLHVVCRCVGRMSGDLVYSLGNAHLYHNHLEQADLQLTRKPLPQLAWVDLSFDPDSDLRSLDEGDVALFGYEPYPAIPAPVAV
jgi:thymidylate synthase